MFKALKATVGLHVNSEHEEDGLDIHEHGSEAYASFMVRSSDALFFEQTKES